ncbi:MAG: FMN-binding protein [Deltaproteobacteria bacterium]|nr:FMN-binding protein [Deltaproteobacteria bacterium]
MKKRLFSIVYMFIMTLFFTSLVSAVKVINEKRIERNEQIKLQRIILRVLKIDGETRSSDADVVKQFGERIRSVKVKDTTLYVGYEEDGRTIGGYAFPVGGPGFWGPVYGMVAVNRDASKILGIAFYKHSETPGLGGRMTEPWFTGQFEGLSLYPVTGDKKIFYLKPQGTKKAGNELDAITGATGTSRAVEAFLNQDLDHFLNDLWGAPAKRLTKDT